jgi:hypothetical protein
VIVKTLSENKAFQQFALRTAKKGGEVVNTVKGKADQAKVADVRRPAPSLTPRPLLPRLRSALTARISASRSCRKPRAPWRTPKPA